MEPKRIVDKYTGKVHYTCPICDRSLDIFLDGNIHRECQTPIDKVKEGE